MEEYDLQKHLKVADSIRELTWLLRSTKVLDRKASELLRDIKNELDYLYHRSATDEQFKKYGHIYYGDKEVLL